MSKIKVTGLELETANGKKVTLSLEEARELHEQLNELFRVDVKYVNNYPNWDWNQRLPVWSTPGWNITCGTAGYGRYGNKLEGTPTLTSTSTGMKLTCLVK